MLSFLGQWRDVTIVSVVCLIVEFFVIWLDNKVKSRLTFTLWKVANVLTVVVIVAKTPGDLAKIIMAVAWTVVLFLLSIYH